MSHILWHPKYPTVMVGVQCKGCGTLIRSQVEDELYEDVREVNGRIVVFKRMVMASLPPYAEIEMELHDGNKITTSACQSCAASATPDTLQEWFGQDLDAMDDEDARNRIKSSGAERVKATLRAAVVKNSAKHQERMKDAR